MGFFNRTKELEESFQLSLAKTELHLGEELNGILSVKSEIKFDIEMIWVRLRCEESEGKENAILYDNVDLDLSDAIHVNAGFEKEFPFVIKLPSIGRETYHSIRHNVRWLVDVYIKVKGKKYAISADGSGEILVAKPSVSPLPVKEVKEVVREVVLIPCAYCSGLMPQTSTFCPNCGARRKG
jgi:hypothetical protein